MINHQYLAYLHFPHHIIRSLDRTQANLSKTISFVTHYSRVLNPIPDMRCYSTITYLIPSKLESYVIRYLNYPYSTNLNYTTMKILNHRIQFSINHHLTIWKFIHHSTHLINSKYKQEADPVGLQLTTYVLLWRDT